MPRRTAFRNPGDSTSTRYVPIRIGVNAGSLDPSKVRDALAATKNFPLLEGNMNGFNSLHEMIMPISVNEIKDGKFKPAGVITDLDAFAPPEK